MVKFSLFMILLASASLISAEKEINRSECEFCELIIYRINYLRKENTLDKIPDLMNNICYSTEDIYFKYMCETLSNNFVITILMLLDNGYDKRMNSICEELDLCNIYSNDNLMLNEDKLICEFIYSSMLNDTTTLQYIDDENDRDEYIGKTCSELAGIYNAKCENMLITNGNYIKSLILKKIPMNRTCNNILFNHFYDEYDNFTKYEL
jgi:hypothetical protein